VTNICKEDNTAKLQHTVVRLISCCNYVLDTYHKGSWLKTTSNLTMVLINKYKKKIT
jgi:hypothetical protein